MAASETMIERVARAIADPGKYCGFRGDRGMSEWQARAAIEAMREPSEEMLEAGWQETPSDWWSDDDEGGLIPVWHAMIEEALTHGS